MTDSSSTDHTPQEPPMSPRSRRKTNAKLDNNKGDSTAPPPLKRGSSRGSSTNNSPANNSNSNNSPDNNSNSAANSKKKCALSPQTVEYLKAWILSPSHIEHPYPTEEEKAQIMTDTGIELKQLTNWFVNNRKRFWKPKVEELRKQIANGSGANGAVGAGTIGGGPSAVCAPGAAASASLAQAAAADALTNAAATASDCTSNNSNSNKRAKHQHSNSSSPKSSSSKNAMAAAISPTNNRVMRGKTLPTFHHNNKNITTANQEELLLSPTTVINPIMNRQVSSVSNHTLEDSDDGYLTASSFISHGTNTTAATMPPTTNTNTTMTTNNANKRKMPHPPILNTNNGNGTPMAPFSSSSIMDIRLSSIHPPSSIMKAALLTPNTTSSTCVVPSLDNIPLDNVEASHATSCLGGFSSCSGGLGMCDPLQSKMDRYTQPCALCSACRDWNLGEFCPWDLTGIIGDMSTDGTIVSDCDLFGSSSNSSSSGSTSHSQHSAMDLEEGDADAARNNLNEHPNDNDNEKKNDHDGDNKQHRLRADSLTSSLFVPQEIVPSPWKAFGTDSRSASLLSISAMVDIEAWE